MSKEYPIKWNQQDLETLSKAVKDFNKKVSKLTKENPNLSSVYPDKVQYREIKKLINTRKDLNREVSSLNRFLQKGSEDILNVPDTDYNLKVTRWTKNELNRRISGINKRRADRLNELKELEATSRGEILGYKALDLGMGTIDENALRPTKAFTKSMSQKDLQMKWKSILQQSQSDYFTKKDYQLRENVIKAISENYKKEDIKDVIKSMKKMNIDDFYKKYMQEGGNFEFYYPPDEKQYQEYLEGLKSTWIIEKVKPEELIDLGLK